MVAAISETTARAVVRQLNVSPKRIVIVPPYIHLEGGDDAAAGAVLARVGARGDPIFLFVGIPEAHKRPELAIEAFSTYA